MWFNYWQYSQPDIKVPVEMLFWVKEEDLKLFKGVLVPGKLHHRYILNYSFIVIFMVFKIYFLVKNFTSRKSIGAAERGLKFNAYTPYRSFPFGKLFPVQ